MGTTGLDKHVARITDGIEQHIVVLKLPCFEIYSNDNDKHLCVEKAVNILQSFQFQYECVILSRSLQNKIPQLAKVLR